MENATLLLRRTGCPPTRMTLSTRTHDASFGPLYHQDDQPWASVASAPARGTRLTNMSLTAGPVPWLHGHATPCLPLLPFLTIIVIRSIPQSFLCPARRRMLRRASLTMRTTKRWFGSRTLSMHWSKPAIWSSGVSSAVATVRALRFSAMIIGPSRAEDR